jgi:hypothetical protein
MSEPADPTTPRSTPPSVSAVLVLAARDPQDAPGRRPQHPPRRRRRAPSLRADAAALTAAATRARQAQIADRVEELDGRIIDLIVAAQALLLERGFETAMLIWAPSSAPRRLPLDEPKLGIELPRLAAPTATPPRTCCESSPAPSAAPSMLRTRSPSSP